MAVPKTKATLESYVPGRMRMRVPRGTNPSVLQAVVAPLGAVAGVLRVAANTLSGGLLLEFDPEVLELAEIVTVLEAANIALDVGLHVGEAVLSVMEARGGTRVAQTAHREHEQLHGVDRALHRLTGGAAGVKGLLPFLLIAVVAVALRHGWLTSEGLGELVERFRS